MAWFIDSHISKARGKIRYWTTISEYFSSFLDAAASAADSAREAVLFRYEAATVSLIVTSQVAQRPSRHGICERPPGSLPSALIEEALWLLDGR